MFYRHTDGTVRSTKPDDTDGWTEVEKADLTASERVALSIADIREEQAAEIGALKAKNLTLERDIEDIRARMVNRIPAEVKEDRKLSVGSLIDAVARGAGRGLVWHESSQKDRELYESDEFRGAQRDMTIGADSGGGFLVPTTYLPGSFIDLVRNAQVVRQLGATSLDGLTTPTAYIPKLTGDVTAYWVAEGGSITESTPSVGDITLEAREVAAFTELTNRVLKWSTPAAMKLVENSMAQQLALAVDLKALTGDGGSATPVGVRNCGDGLGSTTMNANPTRETLKAMMYELRVDNTFFGKLGWAMSPRTWDDITNLTDSSGRPLFPTGMQEEESMRLLGYPVRTTNAIVNTEGSTSDESAIYFGNWSDVLIATWGGIEFMHSSVHASNLIKRIEAVVATMFVDVKVLRGKSFVVDITARSD